MASPLFIAQKFFSQLQNNISQSNDPPNQCAKCTPGNRPDNGEQQLHSSSSQAPEAAARLASAAIRSLGSSKVSSSVELDAIWFWFFAQSDRVLRWLIFSSLPRLWEIGWSSLSMEVCWRCLGGSYSTYTDRDLAPFSLRPHLSKTTLLIVSSNFVISH